MSAPHPPPGPGEPPTSGNGLPPPATPSASRFGGRRASPGMVAAIAGVVAVAAIGIGVAVARSGDDAGSTAPSRPAPTSPVTAPPSSAPPTTPAPPSTAPGSTTSTSTIPPTTSTLPATSTLPVPEVPADTTDLGEGISLVVPPGWARTSGPDDPVTISDGTTWYTATVVEHEPDDGPAELLQDVVDTFDGEHTSVSYSPVRYQGTVSASLPADEYRVVYSAITEAGGRTSGAVHTFLRGDGLAVVVHAWNLTDTWPEQHEATDPITEALARSLTAAPPIATAETLPIAAPFRVTSEHPLVAARGLAGFTVPPGFDAWPPVTVDGITLAGASNGITDVVAIAMPAPATVDEVFAAVVDDLDERYPGLVVDTPSPQGTRDGVSRLGAGFAGTRGGRPIAGGVDAWLVAGDTAYAFAYTYYADIELGGANPDPVATQFAYSAYADSF